MKTHHVASAMLGLMWLLLIPPGGPNGPLNPGAPLSKWHRYRNRRFNSEETCKSVVKRIHSKNVRDAAICISSDDPRLKADARPTP